MEGRHYVIEEWNEEDAGPEEEVTGEVQVRVLRDGELEGDDADVEHPLAAIMGSCNRDRNSPRKTNITTRKIGAST